MIQATIDKVEIQKNNMYTVTLSDGTVFTNVLDTDGFHRQLAAHNKLMALKGTKVDVTGTVEP